MIHIYQLCAVSCRTQLSSCKGASWPLDADSKPHSQLQLLNNTISSNNGAARSWLLACAGYDRDESGLELEDVRRGLTAESLDKLDAGVLAEGIDSVRGGWPPQKCAMCYALSCS